MRKSLIIGLVAASASLVLTTASLALPGAGFSSAPEDTAVSRVDEARVFCYNRYTGMFKHWGACNNHPPRVYCYNRYTGQFKHWGACGY